MWMVYVGVGVGVGVAGGPGIVRAMMSARVSIEAAKQISYQQQVQLPDETG